ncbi:MAG TPA: ABC transporter permease [Thermoanaerobaculia bacterium]|jgi:predicted permease|nr:ABC transporter permease [Thermoanaerobaculia bacterium]
MAWKVLTETLEQDIRYALRLLRKHKATTFVSIATLALGIGATTSIFSLIYGVLLRPLPYPRPDRIVAVERAVKSGSVDPDTTAAKYLFWKESQRSLASIAAGLDSRLVTLDTPDRPERLEQRPVTAGFFEVLGRKPVVGRMFVPGDDRPGAVSVAVLSQELWQRHFVRDPGVLGRTLSLDGHDYTVVGVAPDGMDSTLAADVWTSFAPATDPLGSGDNLRVIGRLKDGATLARAQADLENVGQRFRAESPEAMSETETVAIEPYRDKAVGKARKGLLILIGAVSLLLLIACANVANVLMARLVARRHEFTVRLALGGGRGGIVRQLLTESLCLSLLGSLAGLGLARLVIWAVVHFRPVELPRLDEVALDGRVLLFTLGLAGLTTLLFGLVPALQSSRAELQTTLRESGHRGSTGRERVSQAVVVLEFALSVILLVGASLLLRSLTNLWRVDPGFDVDRVMTFQTGLKGSHYGSAAQVDAFARRVTDRLSSIPGVENAALCACLPLKGGLKLPLHSVDGHPKPLDHYLDTVQWMPVTPEFFKVLRIPVHGGREFSATDSAGSLPVAIVSETFARKHFPRGDAVGKRILLGWDILGPEYQEGWREIVGIAGDIHESRLQSQPRPAVFVPLAQLSDPAVAVTNKFPATFLARTAREAPLSLDLLRSALRDVDPYLPVEQARTLREVARDSLKEQRFQAILLGLFALTALVLVSIGIFGVLSHSVAQRTQEIGIRLAMGASPRDVMRLVLGKALGLTALGAALGVPGAFALSRLLQTFLFGVQPHDPVVFVATPLLLAAVALLASYFPARGAAATDAMVTLRRS